MSPAEELIILLENKKNKKNLNKYFNRFDSKDSEVTILLT
jgi:hypothetical protein